MVNMDSTEGEGARIRRLRKRAGLNQAEFGARMGRSQQWVSGVECGDIELDSIGHINRAARVLNVHPNEITGRPYSPGSAIEGRGHAAIVGIRRVVQRFELPPDFEGEPRSAEALAVEVDKLTALRRAARYADLGEASPDVLREIHAAIALADGVQTERLYALLASAYKEADSVAHYLGYDDLSALATERYRRAAARSGNPHLVALGNYLRVRELWALDLWGDALGVIDASLTELGEPSTQSQLSIWGSLQLRAAITAARSCNADEAWNRVALAEQAVSRVPTGFDPYQLTFSAENVAIHAVAVAVELRDGTRAVELVR